MKKEKEEEKREERKTENQRKEGRAERVTRELLKGKRMKEGKRK